MREIKVVNQTRGTTVGDRITVAETSLTRMVGLLGKNGLDAGGGLWIKPSSGVHTIAMKFPIDVIGLDRNHTVIKLWRELAPYRVTSVSFGMRSVLELPPGQIVACKVEVGDSLLIT